jgi:8-oxo-dGTP pyrophosphatase MutT (NUDIX family)
MSPAADAAAVLRRWRPPSVRQRRLRDEFVALLDARPDATSRACVPDHLTASTLVVSSDRDRVLLTLHSRLGRWLQTGGHCEPSDADLASAALREAPEESGIRTLALDPVPLMLDRHEVPCGPLRPAHHLDVQYLAVAPEGAVETCGPESAALAWFAPDTLPDSADASVRALVSAALERLTHGSSGSGSPAASETPCR